MRRPLQTLILRRALLQELSKDVLGSFTPLAIIGLFLKANVLLVLETQWPMIEEVDKFIECLFFLWQYPFFRR